MITRCELPRNTGSDGDSVAQSEADHFEKCPVCSRWFDMRDLAQVADHIHDGSKIEVLEGSAPPPRKKPVHWGALGSLIMGLRGEEPADVNRRDYHLSPS